MSQASAIPEEDFWHVQLPTGEVRYWSLEELDEAFQRDEVDAKTYVLKEGETTWQRLGELLGLDEAPPELVAVAVAPYSISTIPPSMPPPSAGPASEAPGALSIRPVVSDVDDDDMMAAMKPKKKNVAVIAGGFAAALVLVIVGVTHASAGDTKAAAASAPPPAPVVASPPPASAEDTAAAARATLSDDVKRSLLEADKAREAKAAARAAENAKLHTTVRSYRAPKSGQVFHKGGNQFDPLTTGN